MINNNDNEIIEFGSDVSWCFDKARIYNYVKSMFVNKKGNEKK
jgi:hypothetical protein